MNQARQIFYSNLIMENSTDQRKLFKISKALFSHKTELNFPQYKDSTVLANDIGQYFVHKITHIRSELDTASPPEQTVIPTTRYSSPLNCIQELHHFSPMTEDDMKRLILNSNKKTSSLDPMPTQLVVDCLDLLLPIITKMINMSLETASFPHKWKEADVQPKLKKYGADIVFKNLRPISNLSFVSKLAERSAYNQLYDHLSFYNLYPKNQSAYRAFHSTETALLRVKNDILMNMDKQHVTLLCLLELSAAFDTVDHTVLLRRMNSNFGVSGSALRWLTSYLFERSQRVTINGASSELFGIKNGVPQGSCLGPLLFVLYVSDLLDLINSHLPNSHAYADDTQLYVSFRADSRASKEKAILTVEKCIDSIKQWMLTNKLKLNDEKTEILLIGTRQQLEKVDFNSIRVGSTTVNCTGTAKNLGCWFDAKLDFNTHVTKCCKASFFHIFNIRRIRKFPI